MTRASRVLIAGALLGAMASGSAGAVVPVTPRDGGRSRPRSRPLLQDPEIRGSVAHRPQGQRERERRLRQRAKGQLRGRGIDGP